MIPEVRLKPRADKRARAGHPWIFSNEIDGSVKDLPAGGAVDVMAPNGAFIARGYANPHSLIAVRLLTRNRREDIDHPAFYQRRIEEALRYRQQVLPGRESYRMVHAEGDALPGLVVDRLRDVLAVQITTLGMEERKPQLEQAFKALGFEAAVLRNDARVRELEGMEMGRGAWFGDIPESVDVDEYGVTFRVGLLEGQKTGHFFDQTDNRHWLGSLCGGKTVLDVYSNTGGFALHALKHGAEKAVMVEKSEAVCELAHENAKLNGVADRLTILCDEGKRTLESLVGGGHRFDVVNLDPPAFAKTKKVVKSAVRGYREINSLGLSLVAPGGLFGTSSCSFHVDEEAYLGAVQEAAHHVGKRLRLARRGGQGSDHPVVPGIPETRYLKFFGFGVTPAA
ncbi:MAG: class I SAM-dependent rRNA methyltransferase [Deltaproteobacteria bacterium]|nr:MAG: class I SAM-dependent rRNA methyltransferase [Deltaproteobacteria bacterium]